MIGKISYVDGIILLEYEKHDIKFQKHGYTAGPFCDTVWQRWHRRFEKGHRPTDDCLWMILE